MPKIIVGVDESDRSKDAIALAIDVATAADAELVLVCAYPYDRSPSRALNSEYENYLREEAEGTLARFRAGIGEGTAVTTRAIAEVTPAKAIQTVAEQEGAALIVLGSSRQGNLGRVLAGSTAERLLHGAPCPVAVAPRDFHTDGEKPIDTIGVGYDGTAEAVAALNATMAMAASLDARVRIIEVVDVMEIGVPAAMAGPGYVLSADHYEECAREALGKLVESLPADVEVEPLVSVGEPEQELAEQSEGVDLMVVGSRGYGPHRAVLLGSVSGRLVRDAACPVLVVPRGIAAPLGQLFASARAGAV